MKRTDAAHHVGNLFQSGNPLTGQRGTRIEHTWLNAVQQEIARTIERTGTALDPSSYDQLGDTVETLARRVGIASFATLAATAGKGAVLLPTDIGTVYVKGHTIEGLGGAHYRRVAREPYHAGKFRDMSGQWLALNEFRVTPQMFGAFGNGIADDTAALQAAYDFPAGQVDIPAGTYLTAGNALIRSAATPSHVIGHCWSVIRLITGIGRTALEVDQSGYAETYTHIRGIEFASTGDRNDGNSTIGLLMRQGSHYVSDIRVLG